jgi:hypothetical protein
MNFVPLSQISDRRLRKQRAQREPSPGRRSAASSSSSSTGLSFSPVPPPSRPAGPALRAGPWPPRTALLTPLRKRCSVPIRSLHANATLFFADEALSVDCPRRRDGRRPWPDRRVRLPASSTPAGSPSAIATGKVCSRPPPHRQEKGHQKRRDRILYHPTRKPSAPRCAPIGYRKQPTLDDGRDLRRRLLPHPKGRFARRILRFPVPSVDARFSNSPRAVRIYDFALQGAGTRPD